MTNFGLGGWSNLHTAYKSWHSEWRQARGWAPRPHRAPGSSPRSCPTTSCAPAQQNWLLAKWAACGQTAYLSNEV